MPVKMYSVVAQTTPEKAYAYISDVTRHPEWSPDDLKVVREGNGSVAVGTKYQTIGDLQGKPNTAVVEVTDQSEPNRFAFTSTDKNSAWHHEFTLTAAPGGTRIDRKVTVLNAPLPLYLVFPVLHFFVIGPGNMKSMGLLRDRLEGR